MNTSNDINRAVFDRPDVVDFYRRLDAVFAVEDELFRRFVHATDRIVDLGVGAGRTTADLRVRGATYVGVDLSSQMIDQARLAFPDATFVVADAAELTMLDDSSADVVVFSFNGIDCLPTDASRQKALGECHRLLAPRGHLIISRHNPRCVVERCRPLHGVSTKLAAARVGRWCAATARLVGRRIVRRPFWRGVGHELDPHHGGMSIWTATPQAALVELTEAGFEPVAGPCPGPNGGRYRWWRTPWYYVVVQRSDD